MEKNEIGREAWKEEGKGERTEVRERGERKEKEGGTDKVGFRDHCSIYILF